MVKRNRKNRALEQVQAPFGYGLTARKLFVGTECPFFIVVRIYLVIKYNCI